MTDSPHWQHFSRSQNQQQIKCLHSRSIPVNLLSMYRRLPSYQKMSKSRDSTDVDFITRHKRL
jgi:hypothetical protein